MGYQVGRICYRTEKEATDVAMSQVIPSFDKDGNLNMPFYNGRSWMYEHQRIKMSFPYCEYGQYASFGEYTGQTLAGASAIVFAIIVLLKAIKII
ncbi:TPA: hypothetical protein ACX5DF_002016 [Neisseria meningitidis]|nr:hypothetical protein [Neisseria meningitidis]KQB49460.1 hypothetical protein LD10_11945 [Neisseria meningitidis]